MDGVVLLPPPAILCITLLYSAILCSTLHCAALLSGVMYAGGVAMALQGSPTHRYFLAGQKTKLGNCCVLKVPALSKHYVAHSAELACREGRPALISRYFFYTDLRQYGCRPRYFTVVRSRCS